MTSPFPYTIHLNGNTPLLFLHPFPANDYIWRAQTELQYMVITVDMTSTNLADMESIAEGIIDILVTEEIEKTTVCGCSFGGYLAYTLTKYFPHRVSSLILSDTRSENDNAIQRENRNSAILKLENEGISAVASAMENMLGATTKVENSDLVVELNEMVNSLSPQGLIALQKAMLGREDFSPFLPKIDIPITYICGLEDTVTPPQMMKVMATKSPNARFCEIKCAGHLPSIEQPEQFNRIITEHLENFAKE